MKKLRLLIALLVPGLPLFAQTGALQGHCFLGGTPATTSGMNSSNYLNGIIPACTVKVYLHGTTTLATIYADQNNDPLANPFTANSASAVDPGGWLFYAATNQGLDVVLYGGNSNPNCTTAPNCYTTPVTLVDVFPSQSFTPSAGVASITPGTNVTCSPESGGTCTGSVTISASGGGGGIVPSNATFAFTGDSVNDDDGNAIETTAIPIASYSCNGTTCTVTTTSAHGLSAGQWVNMRFSTSDFAAFNSHLPSYIALETGGTVFQVLSAGLTSTQFEFNYSLASPSCSSSCGNAYLASYNLPFNTVNQGALKGIGTVVMKIPNPVSIAGVAANYASMFHAISPAVTGNPGYLIIDGITDDFASSSCNSSSIPTLETNLQTVWSDAHADGWVVVMGSPNAVLYDEYGTVCLNFYPYLAEISQWLYQQGKSAQNAASGTYWDIFADVQRVVNDAHDTTLVASNGGLAYAGADLAASVIASAIGGGTSTSLQKNGDYFGLPTGNTGGLANAHGRVFAPYADTAYAFSFTNAAMTNCVLCINTTTTPQVTTGGATYVNASTSSFPPIFAANDTNSGTILNSAVKEAFLGHSFTPSSSLNQNNIIFTFAAATYGSGAAGNYCTSRANCADIGFGYNSTSSAAENDFFVNLSGATNDSFHAVQNGMCVGVASAEASSGAQAGCPTSAPFSVGTTGQWQVSANGYPTIAGAPSGSYVKADGTGYGTPAGGGAMTNISNSVTPTNATCSGGVCTFSGVSSVTFASIPQTYNHLLLEWSMTGSVSNSIGCGVQFNGDTGSDYAEEHFHVLTSTVQGSDSTSATSISLGCGMSTLASVGTLSIPFYAQSIPHSTLTEGSAFSSLSSAASNYRYADAGLWDPATAAGINTIKFIQSSGTMTGSVAIYGVN
jgi:hypothetical protein